ncbi:hypothetical protein HGRIS_004216 [Hohenbuehelia grisea]|uniref:Uncharacterized protein n=1 Tax=Hohenbuehelia grisea TaxID=104357 RepID=A0ABR3JIT1_9AGAR
MTESPIPRFWSRSVNVEIPLEAGEYVVHVRLDRQPYRRKEEVIEKVTEWNTRKHARILTERAISRSIASNYIPNLENIPVPLDGIAGIDLNECKERAKTAPRFTRTDSVVGASLLKDKDNASDSHSEGGEEDKDGDESEVESTSVESDEEENTAPRADDKGSDETFVAIGDEPQSTGADAAVDVATAGTPTEAPATNEPSAPTTESVPPGSPVDPTGAQTPAPSQGPPVVMQSPPPMHGSPLLLPAAPSVMMYNEDDVIFLGLRVYTDKAAPAIISGQLRVDLTGAQPSNDYSASGPPY